MFPAWDFHGWFGSIVILLLMGGLLVGFSVLVSTLLSWIWGPRPEVADMHPKSKKKRTLRSAMRREPMAHRSGVMCE